MFNNLIDLLGDFGGINLGNILVLDTFFDLLARLAFHRKERSFQLPKLRDSRVIEFQLLVECQRWQGDDYLAVRLIMMNSLEALFDLDDLDQPLGNFLVEGNHLNPVDQRRDFDVIEEATVALVEHDPVSMKHRAIFIGRTKLEHFLHIGDETITRSRFKRIAVTFQFFFRQEQEI